MHFHHFNTYFFVMVENFVNLYRLTEFERKYSEECINDIHLFDSQVNKLSTLSSLLSLLSVVITVMLC